MEKPFLFVICFHIYYKSETKIKLAISFWNYQKSEMAFWIHRFYCPDNHQISILFSPSLTENSAP